MTERTFTIHREGIDRFTAIVDGEEVVAVRAADYDAMETARDMLGRELDEAEAELAHIKQFLSPTGWQKAQDEHNALRAQLAEAQEELAQWRATGESVTRNEHDLSARLEGMQDLYIQACERRDDAMALLRDSDAAYEQRRFGKWMQDVAVFLGKAPDSASVEGEK